MGSKKQRRKTWKSQCKAGAKRKERFLKRFMSLKRNQVLCIGTIRKMP
jgi:hypothetical protein